MTIKIEWSDVLTLVTYLWACGLIPALVLYVIGYVRSKWKSNQVAHIADIVTTAVNYAQGIDASQNKRNTALQVIDARLKQLGLTKHANPELIDGLINQAVLALKVQTNQISDGKVTTPTVTTTTTSSNTQAENTPYTVGG